MTRTNRPLLDREDAGFESSPPPPSNASVLRLWKFRRNVVIYLAYRQGATQRDLADVFELRRSRIGAIIKGFSAYGPAPDMGLVPFPPPPSSASVIQRWRFRRNVVIYLAYRQGITQPVLADVFGLPRSRICAIVKDFSGYDPVPRAARTTRRRRPERPATAEGARATSGREAAGPLQYSNM